MKKLMKGTAFRHFGALMVLLVLFGICAGAVYAMPGDGDGLEAAAHESAEVQSSQVSGRIVYDDNDGGTTVTIEGTKILPYKIYHAYDLNTLGFSKYGFHFTGWNTAADGSGDAISEGQPFYFPASEGGITLYAQWEHDGKSVYSFNYWDLDNMNNYRDTVIPGSVYTIKDGAAAGLNKPGYVVAYWNTALDGGGQDHVAGDQIVMNSHYSLIAQWVGSDVRYRVDYDANGGENGYTHAGISPVGRYSFLTAERADVSRKGYNLTGWNTSADGSGISYEASDEIILKGDLTVYAQWIYDGQTQFTATYEANGADTGVASWTTGETLGYLEEHAAVDVGTTGFGLSTGYFLSWNTKADGTGREYLPGDPITITEDITLYAQWQSTADHVITYRDNYGHGLSHIEYAGGGENYVVLDNEMGWGITGLAFKEWNTAANGSGTAYAPGDTFIVNGDVDLYAMWDTVGRAFYTVRYMPNGGSGTKSVTQREGEYCVLTAAEAGVSNGLYTFFSWNTKANGSGVTYMPGTIVTLDSNLTLYAQWRN